ncbi:hypothetical protein FHS68_003266 [Dyadobacter arcticus]|uniref:Uncharacterized protein n=1 Tax=Dyadobacter arcticus TaxID=1078754 RepID=A0ABX0UQ50_9BACT|nr:hypothetical protein [Dyadobacter arcticus]
MRPTLSPLIIPKPTFNARPSVNKLKSKKYDQVAGYRPNYKCFMVTFQNKTFQITI